MEITHCKLCGDLRLEKYPLPKAAKSQMCFDEQPLPEKQKYDFLICKECLDYFSLQFNNTDPIQLEKQCGATIKRIAHYKGIKLTELEGTKLAKYEKSTNISEEDYQLPKVILPPDISNIFTTDSSVVFQPVSSEVSFVASMIPSKVSSKKAFVSLKSLLPLTTIIPSLVENQKIAMSTKVTEDAKLPVATATSTALTFDQKRRLQFPDEHPSVPRTKKCVVNQSTVTTNYIKHTKPSLSSTKDMRRLFEQLKMPYQDEKEFIKKLLLLELHRSQRHFTLGSS